MSLEKRALKGTIASVVALVVQLGLQIVSVPVLLEHWGEEEYGVWLAINSLYGLLITIDGGHQNYVGNELMKLIPISAEQTKTMIQAGVGGAALTALLELIVVVVLGATGVLVSLAGLTADRTMDLWICLGILLAMWISIGSVGGVLVRLYQPMGEYARATWLGLVQRTLMGLAPVIVAAFGGSIRQATLAASSIPVVVGIFIFNDLRRFGQFRPFIAKPNWRLVGRNLSMSIWLTATGFIAQAQQHFFLVVVAFYMGGAAAIPAFTTMRTVANIFLQGANTLSAPLLPDIVRFKASGDLTKLEVVLRSLAAMSSFVMGSALVVATPILPTAYALWTRGHTAFNSGLYALLGSAVLVRVFGSPMMALIFGVNALGPQLVGASMQCAVTIGVAGLMVPLDGLRGAGIAVLAGEVTGSLIVPALSLHKLDPNLTALVKPTNALTAASSMVIVVALFLSHAYLGMPGHLVTLLGVVALAAMALPLWKTFPDEMRARLLRLLRVRA